MTYKIPYSFVPGTKARAQEINSNFTAVMEAINNKADNDFSNISKDAENVIKNNTSIRNLGEIFCSLYPLSDSGLHLLDGSLLRSDGIYQDFVSYMANLYGSETTPSYFCTESEWQNSVSTYGVCGKFVYDSDNDTIRLPKVTGIVEGTTNANTLGNIVKAGLPVHTHTRGTMDITGTFGKYLTSAKSLKGTGTGCFSASSANDHGAHSYDDERYGVTVTMKASNSWSGNTSNPVYNTSIQNNSTVQPQTIKVFYYIVVATNSKTEIQVNIDNIATDLNGKADKDGTNMVDNLSSAATTYLSGLGMPSCKKTDLTLGASATKYTAPANGWFAFLGKWTSASTYVQLANAVTGFKVQTPSTSSTGYYGLYLPVLKGDVVGLFYGSTAPDVTSPGFWRFYYAQGAK